VVTTEVEHLMSRGKELLRRRRPQATTGREETVSGKEVIEPAEHGQDKAYGGRNKSRIRTEKWNSHGVTMMI
jgi:hypothetical protein